MGRAVIHITHQLTQLIYSWWSLFDITNLIMTVYQLLWWTIWSMILDMKIRKLNAIMNWQNNTLPCWWTLSSTKHKIMVPYYYLQHLKSAKNTDWYWHAGARFILEKNWTVWEPRKYQTVHFLVIDLCRGISFKIY